jgi:hypothetical protein
MMQRPNPGSVIEIEVMDIFGPRMIPPQPESRRYTGTVVKSHKWLTDREFCMTGDAAWPIRVINLGMVRDMRILQGDATNVDSSVQTWEVKGSRGDRYLVTRDAQGWSCDCKGFQFRKNCRHIAELSAG